MKQVIKASVSPSEKHGTIVRFEVYYNKDGSLEASYADVDPSELKTIVNITDHEKEVFEMCRRVCKQLYKELESL